MTTMTGSEKFNEGQRLFARIKYYSDYSMVVLDENGHRHTFLSGWFKDTIDEFHGVPTRNIPDGIKVKFQKVKAKELPFWLMVVYWFGGF